MQMQGVLKKQAKARLEIGNSDGDGDGDTQSVAHARALIIEPDFHHTARHLGGGKPARSPEARLLEVEGLAEAIGVIVEDTVIAPIRKISPAAFLGKGKIEEISDRLMALQTMNEEAIEVVIFDGTLSPIQQRNLEKAWRTKVIDRTGLILEIFGERAKTHEGRLQVELAHLTYQMGRLVGSWTHLERQRGGVGFVGGAGETQIEADRRAIRNRVSRLKSELEQVTKTRTLHRKGRSKVPYGIVALVGYTNAGKSTLFNKLTGADVFVEDQLFATLDPTMRRLELPSGREIVLSDTVGFISDLPHDLIAAFRATLEEVLNADVVVHVRDIASHDTEAQSADVSSVLEDLGITIAEQADIIEFWNKSDVLDADDVLLFENQAARQANAILGSARTGEHIDVFLKAIDARLSASDTIHSIMLMPAEGAALAWLYRHGEVIERNDSENGIALDIRLADADLKKFESQYDAVVN